MRKAKLVILSAEMPRRSPVRGSGDRGVEPRQRMRIRARQCLIRRSKSQEREVPKMPEGAQMLPLPETVVTQAPRSLPPLWIHISAIMAAALLPPQLTGPCPERGEGTKRSVRPRSEAVVAALQ